MQIPVATIQSYERIWLPHITLLFGFHEICAVVNFGFYLSKSVSLFCSGFISCSIMDYWLFYTVYTHNNESLMNMNGDKYWGEWNMRKIFENAKETAAWMWRNVAIGSIDNGGGQGKQLINLPQSKILVRAMKYLKSLAVDQSATLTFSFKGTNVLMKFQSKYNIKELWFRQIQNFGSFTPFTKEMNRFPEFQIKDEHVIFFYF